MAQLQATFGNALLEAHRALVEDLRDLEATRATDQPEGLAARLERTRNQLAEHFRFEEQNGYLASVLERYPHLKGPVQHLVGEHRHLLRSLDELRGEVQQASLPAGDLGQRVAAWIRQVRRHERRENVLVEDAFNLDLTVSN